MKHERELLKKITNPFFDTGVRFETYKEFAKQYDRELNKKKTILEMLKETLQRKKKVSEEDSDPDFKEEEPVSVPEETITEEDVLAKEESKNPPTERELIEALKKPPEIQEECDIKKAVVNNNIKFKLEIKITNPLEEEAWGFMYQRYYSVENSTTAKSGQIKGFLKLQDLRREYLDRLLAELADEVSSKEIYMDVKHKLLEHLNKDDVTVY